MSRLIPHQAMRPLWRCRNCGAPWPCQPARLALLAEYRDDRAGLLIYLGTLMAEASDQLTTLNGHVRPADLHDRFLGWARAGDPVVVRADQCGKSSQHDCSPRRIQGP